MSYEVDEPGDAPHRGALRTLRRVALVLAVLLGAVDLAATAVLFKLHGDEADRREAQACRLFVDRHDVDVNQLKQTRQYLQSLSAKQRREPLNQTVRRGLVPLAKRTRAERPPVDCRRFARRPR